MHYITSTYWQSAPNHSTLLLQHYQYKHIPICLLALCTGREDSQGRAGAYLSGQLLQWFRKLSIKGLTRNPEKQLISLEASLQILLEQRYADLISCGLIAEASDLPLSGFLCADDHFLLFHCGKQKVYFFNRAFGQSVMQCLTDSLVRSDTARPVILRQGIFQQDVGLLIATDTFNSHLTEQEIRECLYVKDLNGKNQIQRRLQELGRRGESLGSRNMAAAVLLTRYDAFGNCETS